MWIEAYFIVAAVIAVVILSIGLYYFRKDVRAGAQVDAGDVDVVILLSLSAGVIWPIALFILVIYLLAQALLWVFIKS